MMKSLIAWAGITWLAFACSEVSMQSGHAPREAFAQKEVPQAAAPEFQPQAQAQPEAVAISLPEPAVVIMPEPMPPTSMPPAQPKMEMPPELDPVALEPAMVGGAFLVCIQSTTVDCRVDTMAAKNVVIDPLFQLNFFYQNKAVNHAASAREGYRWKLDVGSVILGSVEIRLHISFNGAEKLQLKTILESSPIFLGDGATSVQIGCPAELGRSVKPFGLEFSRAFKLDQKTDLILDLQNVCGVARPNDTFVQILNEKGESVFQGFLPVNSNQAISQSFVVPGLTPGNYRAVMKPGNDIDIDDFYVSNFSVSTRVN